jgi:two-component system LytT family response regulator
MKIVIIEDEPLVAKDLTMQLKKLVKDPEFLVTLNSVESAKKWFAENKTPDLIFSDIQLSDGVSFDIFIDFPHDCPIIFTTAYNEYAIRAFKLNSIDYLLKPIQTEELSAALDKYYKFSNAQNKSEYTYQMKSLMQDLHPGNPVRYKERFSAHYKNTIVSVKQEQVAYFVKDELIFLVTTDHKSLVTDYNSLEELEELLDPKNFHRANRQCIVNISAIDHLSPHYTGKVNVVLMKPLDYEISVSREKATKFRQWFEGN